MTYIIQIKPSGNLLFVEDGETVLQAALKAGYEFPYSCGSATCGSCMGKVLNGGFNYGNVEPYALDQSAQDNGFALFCSVKPTSDMVIEVEDVYAPHFIPARKAEYTVKDFKAFNNEVYQVFLSPKKKPIRFHAGQYVNVVADDGIHLPFSIANMANDNFDIELQVKAAADNPYTSELIKKITNKKNILMRGPYGSVRYYDELDLPIIFMAGGTGIVPIKGLIEKALSFNKPQKLQLFWGGKTQADLYLFDYMTELAAKHDQFEFIPVLSNQEDYWQGETGLVHEVIVREHNDLSGHQVYASGPSDMVYAAYDQFLEKGLKPQLMFSDTFEVFPRES